MRTFLYLSFLTCIAVCCQINVWASSCPGYRTYTQNQWGASSCGSSGSGTYNAYYYLQNNFAAAFPNGLTVGCNNKLKLTSAAAVRNYLPQTCGGSALPSGTQTNPTANNNEFAGEVVALALNIRFDEFSSSFAGASGLLKNLIVEDGTFQGWTVQQVFDEANKKLGGCGCSYSIYQLQCAVNNINENYINGCVTGCYLDCPIVVTGTVCNITCHGNNNGSINLCVDNYSGCVYYNWSNGKHTQDINCLSAGTYTVTVTNNGQTVVKSFTVTEPAAIVITKSSTNVTCYGQCNGSAVASATGGTAPYSYKWSCNKYTASINNLCPGTYTVTVTDSKGCCKTSSVVITQPAQLNGDINFDYVCGTQCNGSLTASACGGTAPYSYQWSNGATGATASNLCAGCYYVTITDSKGCTKIKSSVVLAAPLPVITGTVTSPTCSNACSGTINVNATSYGTHTYLWSDGSTAKNRSNLCAGTYTVTATNCLGCSSSATYNVVLAQTLVVTSVCPATVPCANSCSASINITVSGGTQPYNYIWSNGATTEDVNGLCAGQYTVTVTDANGCSYVKSHATIASPAPIVVNVTSTNPTCYNEWTGAISLNITGGAAPYSIVWNNAYAGSSISELVAGTYCYTVTDANGCSAANCVTLVEPDPLLGYVDCGCAFSRLCAGACDAQIDLTVAGGVAPFAFGWSNGATTEDVSNLCVGFYTVTITDANGCTYEAAHAPFEEVAPLEILVNTSNDSSPSDDICDGSASVSIQGGIDPYAAYWSNGFSGGENSGLCAGDYCVTVSDFNGCSASECFTIGCIALREDMDEQTQSSAVEANVSAYPSLFTNKTTVHFTLGTDDNATLSLYNAAGQKVSDLFDGPVAANQSYSINVDGSDFAYGMYVYRLVTTNGTYTGNLVRIK